MAAPPHYALFSGTGFVGSEHDYTELKRSYEKYKSYLQKTAQERHLIPRDSSEVSWAILCDSGYIGDVDNTPGLRKIALLKRTSVVFASVRQEQRELARLRVPIECFFGRLQKLWSGEGSLQVRTQYFDIYTYCLCRWDHNQFDKDFDLCVLLTNEQFIWLQKPSANFISLRQHWIKGHKREPFWNKSIHSKNNLFNSKIALSFLQLTLSSWDACAFSRWPSRFHQKNWPLPKPKTDKNSSFIEKNGLYERLRSVPAEASVSSALPPAIPFAKLTLGEGIVDLLRSFY